MGLDKDEYGELLDRIAEVKNISIATQAKVAELPKSIEATLAAHDKRITTVESNQSWLWRTIVGVIIGAVIGFIVK